MARQNLLLDLKGQNIHFKNKGAAWGQELLEACDGMSTVCVDASLKALKIPISKQVYIDDQYV